MSPFRRLAIAAVALCAVGITTWICSTRNVTPALPSGSRVIVSEEPPTVAISPPPNRTEDSQDGRGDLDVTRRITGQITDRAGGPIAGARIVAVPCGAAEAVDFASATRGVAETGGAGRFSLDPAGNASRFDLVASADGFAAGLRESVALGDDVTITLDPAFALVGIVMDRLGKPIASAAVRWFGWVGAARLTRETTSAADGSYRLANLPESQTRDDAWSFGCDARSSVEARAAAFAPLVVEATEWLRANRPRGDVTLNLVLLRGATVSGRVLDGATHAPIGGARVVAWQTRGDRWVGRSTWFLAADDGFDGIAETESGADGAFELMNLAAESLHTDVLDAIEALSSTAGSLIAVAPGYAPATASWPLTSDGSSVEVELLCWPSATVRGRVVDVADSPVGDAIVSARDHQVGWAPPAIVGEDWESPHTDAAGRYTLRVEATYSGDGPVEIRASSANHSSAASDRARAVVDVRAGETVDAPDLVLGPLQPSVRISVTDAAGTPLARAVVEHVCNRNGSCDARVETDARGFARLFVTQATSAFERHTVIVHSTGFASTVSAPFTPSVDDPPTVAMVLAPGRTLRGRVVDATNAPVPGARVAVDNPIEADRQWAVEAVGARAYEMLVALGRLGGATCAEDGSFEVHDLPGGPWRVGACRGPWLNGFGLTRRDVAAGTEAVTLTLPPAEATSSLEFTLTDAATGEPVLRFDAALETTYRTSHFERIAPGRFRFLRVPADSWTLRVRAPGYLPIERSGVAPSRDGPGLPIALRAERGCVVRGVVRGAADLGNAVIVFRRTDDRSGAPVGQNREPWSRIAHDGSYAASGFASGVYQPLVRTWDWRTETTLLGPSPPTTLAVSGDAHDLTLDVEVAPIREVFVSVQQSGDADERGTVIPNSRIEIADTAGRLVWTGEPVTRGDGFTAYLPTGTYTARLAIPGASPREKTFEVRDSWLRIAFDVP